MLDQAHDTDVLEPEPVRQGGLVRKDLQHTFRQPAKPLEPPTPRTSNLGLDRLAIEKRAAAAALQEDGNRKRQRADDGEPHFKVPSLPASRMSNARMRAEETPSHPGGISAEGRMRLEERRRQRGHQREGITAHQAKKVEHPRGLDDFKRRSNRDRDRFHRRDEHPRGWEVTPHSERGSIRDDAPSLRVPNVKWDSTPRGRREGDGSGGWGSTGSRGWDAPTPRASRGSSPDEGNVELDMREWEEEQVRLDRDWYMGAEEGGLMGDEEHNPLSQYDDLTAIKQAAAEVTKRLPKISAKQAQYNADNDLWEANRMVTSGVATRKGVDLDFEDESQSAVHVMVHHLKPPFLDGRTVFTKQLDPINPIRDPTSDMAVFAKKGSALVKEKREQAERAKAAAKLAALGGTALGNIMGVKDEEAEAEAAAEAQAKNATKEDYKGDSKFASHLKTSAGVSSFARNRTLREQREYLPAFACREDLLRTIRDHQGAVVHHSASRIPFNDSVLSYSGNRSWRDGFRKDNATSPIPV
ncbi:hypothetical protein BGW80DRAFT_1161776 [Lactifluus volemus]|nr:hypothetical protein BGW80DRAFT_1161776 [Lactifluus volemus]